MNDQPYNVFSNAAAYERYIGRWSRLAAAQFLRWLNVPAESTWLDVGAGTGILTQAILEQTAPRKVVGIDLSDQYLAYAREVITHARVEWRVGDASQLVFDTPEFDAAVAGLVLNFVPSPEAAVQGMKSAVGQDGTVAAYVWDYMDRMEMMRHFWNAAIAVDASAKAFESGTQYAICNPEALDALFAGAGLKQIEVTAIDVQTEFLNFDDFWQPFLGAQGSVSKYLHTLDEDRLNAIQEQLLQQLPINSNNTIDLTARGMGDQGKAIECDKFVI